MDARNEDYSGENPNLQFFIKFGIYWMGFPIFLEMWKTANIILFLTVHVVFSFSKVKCLKRKKMSHRPPTNPYAIMERHPFRKQPKSLREMIRFSSPIHCGTDGHPIAPEPLRKLLEYHQDTTRDYSTAQHTARPVHAASLTNGVL